MISLVFRKEPTGFHSAVASPCACEGSHPPTGLPAGMALNKTVLIFSFPKMEHHTRSITKKSSVLFVFQTFDFSNIFVKNVLYNKVWTASILRKVSPIMNLYVHLRVLKLVWN